MCVQAAAVPLTVGLNAAMCVSLCVCVLPSSEALINVSIWWCVAGNRV